MSPTVRESTGFRMRMASGTVSKMTSSPIQPESEKRITENTINLMDDYFLTQVAGFNLKKCSISSNRFPGHSD